jgi:hypothetical protein
MLQSSIRITFNKYGLETKSETLENHAVHVVFVSVALLNFFDWNGFLKSNSGILPILRPQVILS